MIEVLQYENKKLTEKQLLEIFEELNLEKPNILNKFFLELALQKYITKARCEQLKNAELQRINKNN